MNIKYGTSTFTLEADFLKGALTLLPAEKEGKRKPLEAIENALREPIGTPPLKELLLQKRPKKVVVVVNDITRPTPYEFLLPPLLDAFSQAGVEQEQITFVIATGIHVHHSRQENEEVFGRELVENYEIISHDPDGELTDLGSLPSGNPLSVNKYIAEADFVITTGLIAPHYFATYSGGRKSILPGAAGRESIQANHAMMIDHFGLEVPLKENPINLDMVEAARRVGVDFILNVVTNSKGEIVEVVAGELTKAWLKGVEYSAEMFVVPLENKADLTLVSAGGFPRDIDMYQAQKALDNAWKATKKGGLILLFAECRQGFGEDTFAQWINEAKTPGDIVTRIKKNFVLGGHKAYAIARVVEENEVILISGLARETTENLFFKKAENPEEALKYAAARLEQINSHNPKVIVMPQGALTVPQVK